MRLPLALRWACLLVAMTVWGVPVRAASEEGAVLVAEFEDVAGWHVQTGTLTRRDDPDGSAVLEWRIDQAGRYALHRSDLSPELESADFGFVAFEYRVDGGRPTLLEFKLQDHPLYNGMQAQWVVAQPPVTGEWMTALLPLAYPNADNWGEYNETHRRLFILLSTAEPGAVLAVKNLRFIPKDGVSLRSESGRRIVFTDPPQSQAPARRAVFLNPDQLAEARRRVNEYAWARQILMSLRREADQWLQDPLSVPTGPSAYGHDYVDPRNGARLRYDPKRPHEHVSPVDGTVFTGEPYDGVWRAITHDRIANAAQTLALVYALTGEEVYGQAAADILREYAKVYPGLEPRGRGGSVERFVGIGKVHVQALDEAVWVLPLARAYDLVRDAPFLSPDEAAEIEKNVFKEAADLLRPQTWISLSNIHAWQNAALTTLGFLLNDESLVRFALSNWYSGFEQQLLGVRRDGLWWEISLGYHFYTLNAFKNLVMTLIAAEYPVGDLSALKAMFDAPFGLLDPDLNLPAINDSGAGSITTADKLALYEVGYALFQDPKYANLLNVSYSFLGRRRSSVEALIYGAVDLSAPVRGVAGTESVLYKESGLAVLRAGRNYALFKFGPHGGSHGHRDKLHFVLHARGNLISPDLGTPSYGAALYRTWYKETLAHNTVSVDGASQRESMGGTLDWWQPHGELVGASASVQDAYPGVVHRRSVALTADLFIVVDQLRSSERHTYDWTYRNVGRLVPELAERGEAEGEPVELRGRSPAYQELQDEVAFAVEARTSAALLWQGGGGSEVRLHLVGSSPVTLITAKGPGVAPTETMDMVIARQEGESAWYVGVLDLTGRSFVKGVDVGEEEERLVVDIETERGVERFWVEQGRIVKVEE